MLTFVLGLKCAAANESDSQAIWPETNAGMFSVPGTCYDNTSGRPARDCFYNGTWSAVVNPCSTNPCTALTNDEHADWSSPDEVGTIVEGTCVAGYSTAVKPSRLCRTDGSWDTEIINPCVPLYCTQSDPSYSAFGASWPASVQAGTFTAGTCLAGYSGTTARTCSLTAEWSTPSPLCQAIQCASISDDGSHQSWPTANAGTEATGVCLTGYEPTDGSPPTRTCDLNGQWGATTNPCSQKKCPQLTDSTSEWPATLGGSTVSGTCKTGYTGSVSRACSIEGVWGTVTGTCATVSCAAETNNNIVWSSTAAGSQAVGTCASGYGASTAPTRPCDASGVWGETVGSCDRLKCASITIDNAEWPIADSMTSGVSGVCVAGWQGAPTRDCDVNGLYSGAVSNPCLRTKCAAINENELGSWPEANAGSTDVTGSCPAGYSGSPTRNCELSGAWGTITGVCSVVQCASERFGSADWPQTSAGSSAAGVCDTGYSGSPSRACSLAGTWEDVQNPCVQNKCPVIEDGDAQWAETPALSLASGECNPGFFGAPTRECDESGNWGNITNPCSGTMIFFV